MKQSYRAVQQLSLVVLLSIPLHHRQPVDTPAQRVIVPIFRPGVSAAHH